MTPRLTSAMLVSALIRRVGAAGGNVAVIARGDPSSGSILLICLERGKLQSVHERVLDGDGSYVWTAVGPDGIEAVSLYLDRRRDRDPDIWLVELDIANAERFAAAMVDLG